MSEQSSGQPCDIWINSVTVHSQSSQLTGARVLVLDDEETVRGLVERSLRREGAEVCTAEDGREGLEILLDQDFDAMVVDLRMRHMDGASFLQEALKIWPWLSVVVITGYASDEMSEKLRALGVETVLEKPFKHRDLIDSIRSRLDEKRGGRGQSPGVSLQSVENQLRMLRRITEPALQSPTLVEALKELTSGLGGCLPFCVLGILGFEDDECIAMFNVRGEVTESFVEQVKHIMYSHYKALSNRPVGENVRVQLEGVPCTAHGQSDVRSTFFVPVIISGEIQGLLVVAASEENTYTDNDISFIYNAANHLSGIFVALSRMRQLAVHDALTGIYNRLHIEHEFEIAWERSRRYGHAMAVLVMDLDHFKSVKDQFGHLVGDDLLREFAQLLKSTARTTDVVGRFGGEEFVVILPHGTRDDGVAFCERLVNAVRDRVFCKGTHNLYITVSVGLSVSDNTPRDDQDGARMLLEEADKAMYVAKHSGRNCYKVWNGAHPENERDGQAPDTKPTNADVETPTMLGPTASHILIVDDDPTIRNLLHMMLRKDKYAVTLAADGQEALDHISEHGGYDIMLADLQMPGISGIELLKKVHALDDSIITIIITGHATVRNAVDSLRYGAYDFVQKPFEYKQLSAAIKRAIDYRLAIRENKQYQRHLSDMVRRKSADLREALERIKASYDFTLEALAGLLDAREKDTGDHSKRVRDLTMILARELQVEGQMLKDIAHGALLHDIGKIGIPDSILLKNGPLNESEWEIMKTHTDIGYAILANSSYLKTAAEVVYAHQERYDGSGYPRGLKGNEICIGARIFAVIDAYDAMRSQRVYRNALCAQEALTEIRRQAGKQFDSRIVQAFLNCHEAIEAAFQSFQ